MSQCVSALFCDVKSKLAWTTHLFVAGTCIYVYIYIYICVCVYIYYIEMIVVYTEINTRVVGKHRHSKMQTSAFRLFPQPFVQAQIKETSKLRVTGLCGGNSPVTGGFPSQRAGNEEMFFHLMTSPRRSLFHHCLCTVEHKSFTTVQRCCKISHALKRYVEIKQILTL